MPRRASSYPVVDFLARGSRPRGRTRAAVLALEGASRVELAAALRLAARFDSKARLVAVDGGLATCRALRRRPDLFVGDCDSAHRPPRGVDARLYPVAKDFSDLSGALLEVRESGAGLVVIAGLVGGRLDHEWANLLEAGSVAGAFLGLIAPTSRGLVVVTAHGLRARTVPGRLVSVFALGRGARVSLRGTAWTLSKAKIAPGSRGLSNLTGARLALEVHDGVAMVVFPDSGDAS